jgi:hypothetical protein
LKLPAYPFLGDKMIDMWHDMVNQSWFKYINGNWQIALIIAGAITMLIVLLVAFPKN